MRGENGKRTQLQTRLRRIIVGFNNRLKIKFFSRAHGEGSEGVVKVSPEKPHFVVIESDLVVHVAVARGGSD